MSNGSSWFTAINSSALFDSTLERSRLIIKQSMAKRMETEIAALSEKYDGKKAAGLESDINAVADRKTAAANYLFNVETGIKRVDALRTELLAAKDSIAKGSAEAFNLHINNINSWIGRQSDDPDSLIANNGNNKGTWRSDVTVVSGAGMSVNLSHQFMGTDYAIVLDDGSALHPDAKGKALIGRGEVDFSKVSMARLGTLTAGDGSTLSGTLTQLGDQTTFTDGTGKTYTGTGTTLTDTDGNSFTLTTSDRVRVSYADGTSAEGTLKTGGLGVMHAWAYGDFNSSDPTTKATAQEAANNAISAAMRKLANMERTLYTNQSGLEGIVNGLNGKAQQLTDEYKKVSEEELTAKQAERRAIETRFGIATNAMSLTNKTTSSFIQQMFFSSSSYEKKSLTDIMIGAVTGN